MEDILLDIAALDQNNKDFVVVFKLIIVLKELMKLMLQRFEVLPIILVTNFSYMDQIRQLVAYFLFICAFMNLF